MALFKFEIGGVGGGEGVFRLVPTSTGEWKAHNVCTNLQSLKGHPEKVGHLRNSRAIHGKWAEERRKEQEFEDADPYVLIVGGGQVGLAVAARLKCLDVPCLIIEKRPRVGGEWRDRYDALCIHDPVWFDHMPYMKYVTALLYFVPESFVYPLSSIQIPRNLACLVSGSKGSLMSPMVFGD
jgi:hypothetical protein